MAVSNRNSLIITEFQWSLCSVLDQASLFFWVLFCCFDQDFLVWRFWLTFSQSGFLVECCALINYSVQNDLTFWGGWNTWVLHYLLNKTSVCRLQGGVNRVISHLHEDGVEWRDRYNLRHTLPEWTNGWPAPLISASWRHTRKVPSIIAAMNVVNVNTASQSFICHRKELCAKTVIGWRCLLV